ncbi:hypothetical protein SDC9_211729 [bioreactor metagenome]|uniref:HTH cro/C1-type domain-containing protein n=1 Tax=bioreactor metagenome TaxID=1076179 RepID=A0A645JLI1_9ZZZZ|nr:helix-turn-helix transcriptional regulator [Candidatus Pelethousia sp.]NCB29805.1 helix-turn-helix domain-containing protein [Clostridia bacterium]
MHELTLAERICRILQEQRLKKVQFAKILGISANYVSLLASGRKTTISEPLAKLIERIYGYSACWIRTGSLPVYPDGMAPGLRADTVKQIRQMSESELQAVASFIQSLERG